MPNMFSKIVAFTLFAVCYYHFHIQGHQYLNWLNGGYLTMLLLTEGDEAGYAHIYFCQFSFHEFNIVGVLKHVNHPMLRLKPLIGLWHEGI